jgi:RNA polymerase sigma factor (sigma-70 family)
MSGNPLDLHPGRLLAELSWTRRLAASLTGGNDAEADEVVQDTWLAALRARPDASHPLRPWLRQVAMNLLRGRVRGQRRAEARECATAEAQPAAATPEELLQRAEMHRVLVEIVLTLDEPLRQTVLQRYFEGRSAAQIAAATGAAAGTVRWRLKTALDELRRRLAERYPDEAQRRRALVLISATFWRPTGLTVSAGLLTIGAGLATLLFLNPAQTIPPTSHTTPVIAVVPDTIDPPARNTHEQQALADCRAAIAREQPELAELRSKRHRWLRPDRLFREGEPNPLAWLELDPVIRRILAGDEPVFPSYLFECRTWVCRLTLYHDDPRGRPGAAPLPPRLDFKALAASGADPWQVFRQHEPAWNIRIQTDPNLLSRITGSARPGGVPSFDALSRRPVLQVEIYLKLAHPTGRPAGGRSTFVPDRWDAGRPTPSTLAACTRSEHDLRAELDRLRADVGELTPPWDRYRAGSPNPALEREFADHLRSVAGRTTMALDCRGRICRLAGARNSFELEAVARPLVRQGPLVNRLDRLSSSNDTVLFAVASEERVDGRALLADDGDRDRISVRLGGDAGGTSFAGCIEEAIQREIVTPGLPAKIKGGAYDELWPLP